MTQDELNVLWVQPHIRAVDFHAGNAGYVSPERIRAMETALHTAYTDLGGIALAPPIDGVIAEVGYTAQRTVEVFNAKVLGVYTGAEVEVRDNIALVLLDRGWTHASGFAYVLPLTLS